MATDPSLTPSPAPTIPDYRGPSLVNLTPALMGPPGDRPEWIPEPGRSAAAVVLLLIDGLGWEQLVDACQRFPGRFPALAHACRRPPILSVAPSTTAAALTSLALGLPPAEHGMIGYKIAVLGHQGWQLLNALRWRTPEGDARDSIEPESFLAGKPFGGAQGATVSRSFYEGSGFTRAAFGGARARPWIVASAIAVECRKAMAAGESFVYAYYEGLDTTAHAKGFGEYYDAELEMVDRLVADVALALPPGAALVVTADHGQVDVGERTVDISEDIAGLCEFISGEGRFRWFHARPGGASELEAALRRTYGDTCWVRTAAQVEEEGWMGPAFSDLARSRIGDVAVVPHQPMALISPEEVRAHEGDKHRLICRHGSLTSAEMLVPLVAFPGGIRPEPPL